MPNQSTKVVPIREGIRASVEARQVVDLAYGLWLANGFRGGTPEDALFMAVRHLSGNTAAGLFLVPKHNTVRHNLYPLCRVARK